MTKRGMGDWHISKATDSKTKILEVLKDGKWHRYKEIVEKTGLSTATVAKHLKELSPIVEKRIEVNSGEYPYPTRYRLISLSSDVKMLRMIKDPFIQALEEEKKHLEEADWNFIKGVPLSPHLMPKDIKNPKKLFVNSIGFYIIDPINLAEEFEDYINFLPNLILQLVFVKFAEKINQKFTKETNYEEFVNILKECYGHGITVMLRFRPDIFLPFLEKEGVLKEWYKEMKRVGNKEVQLMVRDKTEFMGGVFAAYVEQEKAAPTWKAWKEFFKRLLKGEPYVKDEDLPELLPKYFKKLIEEERKKLKDMQRRLKTEVALLDRITDSYFYFSLLRNLKATIWIKKKKE